MIDTLAVLDGREREHFVHHLCHALALRTDGAATFVYTVAGDRLARQDVTVGLVNEGAGRAEIAKGLAPGARIVRANLGPLRLGAPVRIAAPAPAK